MSKARSPRLVVSMTMGMRASGRRLSRSKFMAGSPVVIIGSNSYNPVFRVLTFEYASGQASFLLPRLSLSPRRRPPRPLQLFRFRGRLHCIRRFWGCHAAQIVNGLLHQQLVPTEGPRRVGGTQVAVPMTGVILLSQGVADRLVHLGVGHGYALALGDRFRSELWPDLLHSLGALCRR